MSEIILEPPITKTDTDTDSDKKPKRQPPYAVIIENDDHHTFEYVIEILLKIFNKNKEDALQMTLDIHTKGRKHVWTGTKELAELKVEQVKKFGNDMYAEEPVEYSLNCYMEPMA